MGDVFCMFDDVFVFNDVVKYYCRIIYDIMNDVSVRVWVNGFRERLSFNLCF